MPYRQSALPTGIGTLTDHLDLALAACDDLLNSLTSSAEPHDALRLELTAITHVLQARESAGEVHAEDADVSRCLSSFVSDTDALELPSPGSAVRVAQAKAGNVALIGGRILATELRSSLACLLGALSSRFSLDPEEIAEDEELPQRRADDLGVQVWTRGPEAD